MEAYERLEIVTIEDLREAMRRIEGSDETVVISIDGADVVASAVPPSSRRRTPEQRAPDEAASMSAAGSLKRLIDPDEFKRQIKAARG